MRTGAPSTSTVSPRSRPMNWRRYVSVAAQVIGRWPSTNRPVKPVPKRDGGPPGCELLEGGDGRGVHHRMTQRRDQHRRAQDRSWTSRCAARAPSTRRRRGRGVVDPRPGVAEVLGDTHQFGQVGAGGKAQLSSIDGEPTRSADPQRPGRRRCVAWTDMARHVRPTEHEIISALEGIPGWVYRNSKLHREFHFPPTSARRSASWPRARRSPRRWTTTPSGATSTPRSPPTSPPTTRRGHRAGPAARPSHVRVRPGPSPL